MKPVLLFILLFCSWQMSRSQVPQDDVGANRMKADINRVTSGKQKVDKLLDLASYLENINIDSASLYNEKAYLLAKELNYKEGIIKYATKQSYLYNLQGDFEKGLDLNKMSYELAKEIGDKTKQVAALANTGISYSYLNEYETALDYYNKALEITLDTKDRKRTANIYGIMAGTYINMVSSTVMDSTYYAKALDYGQKALELGRTFKDSILISDNLNVIVLSLNNLERSSEALPYILESMEISKKIGLSDNYAHSLSHLAKYKRITGEYDEAIRLAREAVKIQRQLDSEMGMAMGLKELAICYKSKGDLTRANQTIDEAIKLAESNNLDYMLDVMYQDKAEYLYGLHQYKPAYDFLHKGFSLADSMHGMDIKTQINELEKKYETAIKEQKIQELTNRHRTHQWLIGAMAFSLLGFMVIAFIWYKNIKYKTKILKQEKEQLKMEKKLQSTASIIQGQEEERHRLAKDLHDGLGGMLSGLRFSLNNIQENHILSGSSVTSFDNALSLLDQAISEMRKVAHNMMPESLLKFGLDETLKDFVTRMNASISMQTHYQSYNYTKLDQSLEINLYRIIQEVMNNAIKHAKATDLYIQLDVQKDMVQLSLEDNGIGFDMNNQDVTKGIGLQNIANRVNYMNGTLEISSHPGRGTHYVIEIKNEGA